MKRISRRLAAIEGKGGSSIQGPSIIILRGVDPDDPENEDAGSAEAIFVGPESLTNTSFYRRPGENMHQFKNRAQAAFDTSN